MLNILRGDSFEVLADLELDDRRADDPSNVVRGPWKPDPDLPEKF